MSDPVPPAAPAPDPAPAPPAPEIGIDEFFKVKLVTAQIVEAVPHPKADRLMILQLQVGERRKQIVSGIRQHYTPEQLVGKTIILVDNLKPAKLRGETSEGMLLAVGQPDGGLRLLTTDGPSPAGLSIS
ncbi:MAG: methionine--tRNA ligase subunit beta [Planctomycetota bacterium]|nr:methionine--tRNA ligase subunit beta [Planctomycetota bacterium]